jgi:hypothetical protein
MNIAPWIAVGAAILGAFVTISNNNKKKNNKK